MSVAVVTAAPPELVRQSVTAVQPFLVCIETVGGLDKVESELANTGTSTGVLWETEGYIVTSAFHFIHRPSAILVRLPNGTRCLATCVVTDTNRMLTLLKIELPAVPFHKDDSPLNEDTKKVAGSVAAPIFVPQSEVMVGQTVVAVGTVFSLNEPNIAVGIVSGKNRFAGKAIQTDAAVSPNNYGGPLIDLQGRVLGILVPLSITSSSTSGSTSVTVGAELYDAGVGMAIPSDDIQQLLPKWKQGTNLESDTTPTPNR